MEKGRSKLCWISKEESEIMSRFCIKHRITRDLRNKDPNKSEYYRLVYLYLMKKFNIKVGVNFAMTAIGLEDFKRAFDRIEKWEDVVSRSEVQITARVVDDVIWEKMEELRVKVGVKHTVSLLRLFTQSIGQVLEGK